MLFYALLIEQFNTTQIKIYGKEVRESGGQKTYGKKKCIIVDIEPEYLYFLNNTGNIDINNLLKNEKFEKIVRKNFFYEDMPENVTLLKSTSKNLIDQLKKNLSENQDFNVNENIRMFTEFVSLAEQFVITKKIKGPCILEIQSIGESHSYFVTDEKSISLKESNIDFPPLTIGTCFISENLMKVNVYEIVERRYQLLKTIKFNQIGDDLDILVHHNLRINNRPGVWVIDTFECAKILIKGRSFSLDEIVKNKSCEDKTFETLLSLNILDLSKELSEITGHFIQRTMYLRAERTEFLLMHTMWANEWLIYNKLKKQHNKLNLDDNADEIPQEEQSYAGGLVISPKTGLFKDVVLIDFNSLYPSIVIENNLCFSTRKELITEADNESNEVSMDEKKSIEMALLPKILLSLIERRKNLKKQLKQMSTEDKNKRIFDARQHALKITANSIYGCLGSTNRFADIKMASYITAKGRGLLVTAKEEIEKMEFAVIYGDTDSLMIHIRNKDLESEIKKLNINLDLTQRKNATSSKHFDRILESISKTLCQSINKMFEYIVIELEDIFRNIIFLSKKKYAGLTNHGNIIMKGIERRDYCKLSNSFITEIVDCILRHDETDQGQSSDNTQISEISISSDSKSNLQETMLLQKIMKKMVDLKSNMKKYPLSNFILERLLTKHPEKYKAPQGCAHVMLALRINEHIKTKKNVTSEKENVTDRTRNTPFKKNDIISYVIGDNGDAYLPTESINLNYDYYITNQILGPLMRILGVLSGFNIDPIRKLFGIEIKNKVTGNFRMKTNCCKNEQSNILECMKCGEKIENTWLEKEIQGRVIEKVEILYERNFVCSECDHKQQIRLRCFNCNSVNLIFEGVEKKNKEFDLFLADTLSQTGSKFIEQIMENSEYRVVDLGLYFNEEIARSKLN